MSIAEIELFFDRPISFHRPLVSIGIGVTGALMLSQAIYWSKRVEKDKDGWFYKTAKEWEEETGLTTREQETARKRLVETGVMSEVKRGIPCKLYYRVNHKTILSLLLNQVSTNPRNRHEQNSETITETTTETTTDNFSLVASAPSAPSTKKLTAKKANSPKFEEAWQEYPKRGGSNPKDKAVKAWNARVKEGVPEDELLAAVKRYKAYCIANRMLNTRYVAMTATFFGTDGRYKEDYRIENKNSTSFDRTADLERAAELDRRHGVDYSVEVTDF